MKISYKISLILVAFIFAGLNLFSQNNDSIQKIRLEAINKAKKDNSKCTRCHGHTKFEISDKESHTKIRKMYAELIVDTVLYYESNHYYFVCTDCHTANYDSFPHPIANKFADKPICTDCHDPSDTIYNFGEIEKEYEASVHFKKHKADFYCWSCHNSHYYKINARNYNQNISKTIQYDNSICLSCHGNASKYRLILDSINPNILEKHEWLPNQAGHFKNVRCIECHAHVEDSILVGHNIQPKSKAVRKCVECHSTNSLLAQTLYKYQKSEMLSSGFKNSEMIGQMFVVGANRNSYFNLFTVIVFALTIIGISVHFILRIKNK